MKKSILLLLILVTCVSSIVSGQPDLSYYLPDKVSYDPAIPTPRSIIGHEVGEWHITHDRLVSYMQALDKASDRVTLEVTGYTHEARPLLLLTITSPKNHQNIESIRAQHVRLTDPSASGALDTKSMPAVFYMGYSIHGNEPSGANAALLVAYHLAAAKGSEIEKALENTIILFDPSFNPDGLQRFSSWVNARKAKNISVDPYDTEHFEAWPGGRTNHYWFDLNRDWLVAQQPESQARIKQFHAWKPNVLTDHHEMGSNATFFFQPGVPSRMHPLTPEKNLELTRKIGEYHAKALDQIGSLYYTQEGYDDFYYGKGSTFPDVQGAIGILFEQASSRGHAQETTNGILRFPFTIRNQFTAALSSLTAVQALREELLNYQRQFFKDAQAEAAKDPVKAIAFGSLKDKARAFHLAEILTRQQVTVYTPASAQTINGKATDRDAAYIVPLNQPQYRLIKSMFEKRTQFKDSLFYDISSWTLPLAAGLEYEELKAVPSGAEKVAEPKLAAGKRVGDKSQYAYVFEPYGFYAPRALYRLLSQGFRVKVATAPFFNAAGKKFERGSLMIPVEGQDKSEELLNFVVDEIVAKDGIEVYAFPTGLGPNYTGTALGSNSFLTVKKPEVAILVDAGVSANDAGELWHLLDTRFQMPSTLLPVGLIGTANLSRYTTILMPPGNYNAINESSKEKLKAWVQAGGVLVGFENALGWLNSASFGKFEMKKDEEKEKDKKETAVKLRPYGDIENAQGAQETSGAIFEASVDLTHPLLYGYYAGTIPLFKGNNLFMEKSKNPYANPIVFGSSPLQSGYITKPNYSKLRESSVLGVSVLGKGRVIGFTENMAFRAFWFGTNKLVANAIFYGAQINDASGR
jgi:hypothetical protein